MQNWRIHKNINLVWIIGLIIWTGLLLSLLRLTCWFPPITNQCSPSNLAVTDSKIQPSLTPTTTPELPWGYVGFNLPLKQNSYKILEIDHDTVPNNGQAAKQLIFFPEDQRIVIPSLMSDYEFFSLHNYHWTYQYYSLSGFQFSEDQFGEPEVLFLDNLEVKKYQVGNDYWASAKVIGRNLQKYRLNAQWIFHTFSENKLNSLISLVDDNTLITENWSVNYQSGQMELRHLKTSTNYQEPHLLYKFYKPPGYQLSTAEYGHNYKLHKSDNYMCLPLDDISNEPCGFSTSGCTCCNTGCRLLNMVIYQNSDGQLQLAGVLDKLGGDVRFVFPEYGDLSGIYYHGAYSGKLTNYQQEIKEFLKMITSVEKVE